MPEKNNKTPLQEAAQQEQNTCRIRHRHGTGPGYHDNQNRQRDRGVRQNQDNANLQVAKNTNRQVGLQPHQGTATKGENGRIGSAMSHLSSKTYTAQPS